MAHTSRLLQLWRQGDDSHAAGGATRYAELEATVDPAAQPELQSADVTSESFKLLPLDAQIQVMREKAAQRLLAYISPISRPDLAHISLHLPC